MREKAFGEDRYLFEYILDEMKTEKYMKTAFDRIHS